MNQSVQAKPAVPVITVDGPGGSGKGTITTRLANHLGWHFLDSGALYRLTALAAIKQGVSADDQQGLDRKSTRLNSSHSSVSRMPSSA